MMEPNSIPLDKLGIPAELARYVDPSGPSQLKLLAARGLVPAPPRALIGLQYCLLADPDPAVAQAGRDGLLSHPVKLLQGNIDDRTHPKILEFYCFNRQTDDELMEHILLRRQLNDRSICGLAEQVGHKLIEIIAANQERLLTTPAILEHLRRNPNASAAVLERTEAFLRMNNALDTTHVDADAVVQQVITALTIDSEDALKGQLEFRHGFEEEGAGLPSELVAERGEAAVSRSAEEEEPEPEKQSDLWSTVSRLPIAKKIKLAYFGNASVRAILVRDTNKMVATAVMKSPRMTENEVIAIAKNRNVCADVLREISRNKEMFKMYAVKLALVNNPKCPASISMPIVSHLMLNDLKKLSSNRNVPSVITTSAKQILKKKSH